MWISVGVLIAAAMTGQEPQTEPPAAPRYGRLSASANAAAARRAGEQPAADAPSDDTAESWGLDLYAMQPRLTLTERMERDCAEAARPAEEDEAACHERITEAVIQESLTRGNATRRVPDWTEENEREWVAAPRRNPIDRLRDCRQSSERSRDGERSSWTVRCGDQDGPAAQALDRLLTRD